MAKKISAHYTVAIFLRSESSKKFKLKPIDALILRVIADYIDMKPDDPKCFAFQKKLALECRYSARRLSPRIAFLSRLKLIHRIKKYKSYHYFLGEALTTSLVELSSEEKIHAQSVLWPPDELSTDHQTNSPMIIDIEINNKREDINLLRSFDLFWENYPRKIKKKEAQEIWLSKKLGQIACEIIGDVKARVNKDEQWKNKKFIPSPVKYLSGERWTDEIMEKDDEKHQGTDKPNRRQASMQSYLQHLRKRGQH